MKDVFEELEAEVVQYHLNLQLKYQNLKDSIGNNPPTPDKDTSDFDSVFVIGKMQASLQGKDNAIRQLKKQLSKLQVTSSDTERTVKVRTTDSQFTKVNDPVTNLQAQNDLLRAENDKVKKHYKELYDSIKITRAKHIEQVTKLTAKNMTLKTSVSKAKVQPPVLTRTKHAVDVKPIVPRLRNNRDIHLDYLRQLKKSVETIRDIVEEAKVARPLDRSIVSACRYTKHSQELLEYAIGTFLIENLAVNDSRRQFPRFQGENLEHNTALLEKVHRMAKNKGCTTSQLALAWVLHQGEDVCPIPGTTKIENFKENIRAVSVKLSHEDISEVETIASMIKGGRYPDAVIKSTWKHANTPPLASYIAK
nr:hypothetical protein [Tanacetum cinerariifolium]